MENIFAQVLRKQGQNAFRKRLGVYSYRMKHSQYHKRPGMIDLHTKEQLKKQGIQGNYKIFRMERDSDRQFGEFSSRSKFIFDPKRVPFLDIPDLTDFEIFLNIPKRMPLDSLKFQSKKVVDIECYIIYQQKNYLYIRYSLQKNLYLNNNIFLLQLKPYVSVHTPRIEKEDIIKIIKLNDFTNPENFNRYTQIDIVSSSKQAEKRAESTA